MTTPDIRYNAQMAFEPLRNWHNVGSPPGASLQQYAALWHYEVVLRHTVYGSLRLEYGIDWAKKLNKIKSPVPLLDQLTERRERSVENGEFTDDNKPGLIWYTTTHELFQIMLNKDLWRDCFDERFNGRINLLERKILMKLGDTLRDIRNGWAHFRPLDRALTDSALESFREKVGPALIEWMARYFNSRIAPEQDDLVIALSNDHDTELPIVQQRPQDIAKNELDRGWALTIYDSDAGDCWWIEPKAIGLATSITSTMSQSMHENLESVSRMYSICSIPLRRKRITQPELWKYASEYQRPTTSRKL